MAPPKKPMNGRHASKSKTVTSTSTPTPPPNWPALKPLHSSYSLTLSTVLDSQIVLIRNFWTATLCKNYVTFLKTLPLTTTPGKPRKGDAVRFNDRFQIVDEAFANQLWIETGLREVLCGGRSEPGGRDGDDGGGEMVMSEEARKDLWGGEVVGLNPSIRIYRYTKGQFFDCHYDESNNVTLNTKPQPMQTKTTWTLLLYLTSPTTGCQGGETVFYPDDPRKADVKEIVVGLETGMLLLHKHGHDCMLHEGREVTDGEKWVIRTDLCVRRDKSRT